MGAQHDMSGQTGGQPERGSVHACTKEKNIHEPAPLLTGPAEGTPRAGEVHEDSSASWN